MNVIQFISAFGLGAIITALVQSWLSHRTEIAKRNFQEKKECYIGLLAAHHRAAVENTDEAAKNFAYWQMRCELVAPKEVRMAIQQIISTNEDKEARQLAHENLKIALRRDMELQDIISHTCVTTSELIDPYDLIVLAIAKAWIFFNILRSGSQAVIEAFEIDPRHGILF